MNILSKIFPVASSDIDFVHWTVEQYFPSDDNTRFIRVHADLDHQTGLCDIRLIKRSFYGSIEDEKAISAIPKAEAMPGDALNLSKHNELIEAQLKEDDVAFFQALKIDENFVASGIKPENVNYALEHVAQLLFHAVVTSNYAPDHVLQEAVMGRPIGVSGVYSALWKGNWRQICGRSHDLTNYIDLGDLRRANLKIRGGVERLVAQKFRLISPLYT